MPTPSEKVARYEAKERKRRAEERAMTDTLGGTGIGLVAANAGSILLRRTGFETVGGLPTKAILGPAIFVAGLMSDKMSGQAMLTAGLLMSNSALEQYLATTTWGS